MVVAVSNFAIARSAQCASSAPAADLRGRYVAPASCGRRSTQAGAKAVLTKSFISGRALRLSKCASPQVQVAGRLTVRADADSENGAVRFVESVADWERYTAEAGDRLLVLDIATRTCGPCKLIYPKVVALSLEYPDIVFLKINGDHSPETRGLMREWGIKSVPCFRFYRNGELVHSHTGAKEEVLRAAIVNHYLGSPVAAET